MHRTQTPQFPRITRVARQIVHLVRIVGGIEKLLHRLLRPEEELLRALQLPLLVQLPHLVQHGHLIHIGDVLGIRLARLIVANIAEALIAHRADDVVCFIHAVTSHEDVVASRRGLRAEESAPLHVARRNQTGHR